MEPVLQQLKQRFCVYARAGLVEVGLIGKQPIGVEIVVRTKQLTGSGLLDLGREGCVPGFRGGGFSITEVERYKVTIDVILPDQLIELGNLRAGQGCNARKSPGGLVRVETEIVGEAPSGRMALLGDEMVAALGDDVALVLFRLA